MKLTVINGSPRGTTSNSKRMIEWIFNPENTNLETSVFYLMKQKQHDAILEAALEADRLLFVFPLYVDSMPSIVKAFFEKMAKQPDAFKNKPVYFIIHSGFPEIVQNLSLKRYCQYFSEKVMSMDYKGTLIMAGSESLQMAPDNFFNKKIQIFKTLEKTIETGGTIDDSDSEKISGFYKMNKLQQYIYALNPFKDFYWNGRLKKNQALKNAKDQPYKIETKSSQSAQHSF